MDSSSPHYHAYLLRIWQSNGAEDAGWRASLQDTTDGRRIGFASLEALFVYLMNDAAGAPSDGEREPDAGSEEK